MIGVTHASRLKDSICLVVLLSSLWLSGPTVSIAAPERLQDELTHLLDETQFLREAMRKADAKLETLRSRRDVVQQRVSQLEAELMQLTTEIASLETQQSSLREELVSSELRREERREEFSRAIRGGFFRQRLASSSSSFNFQLLNADAFIERRREQLFLARIGEREETLVQELRLAEQQMRGLTAELREIQGNLNSRTEELERARAHLQKEAQELRVAVNELAKERSAARTLLFEFEAKALRLEGALAELGAEQQEDAHLEGTTRFVGEEAVQTLTVPISGWSVEKFLERLPHFSRSVETLVQPPGEEPLHIQAIAPGRVVHLGRSQRLGRVIIVEHIENVFAVYAGLVDAQVLLGQQVGARDTLGVSEAGFFFELRRGAMIVSGEEGFLWGK